MYCFDSVLRNKLKEVYVNCKKNIFRVFITDVLMFSLSLWNKWKQSICKPVNQSCITTILIQCIFILHWLYGKTKCL